MRGLYAIIDPELCGAREPEQVARAVLRGGCAVLQLRDKQGTDADVVRLGTALAALCREHNVPLVVNDRFWLVRQIAATGTHVGQTDASIERVRAELGPGYSVGVSTHSLAQAHDAQRRGADSIGFGPVFGTSTKLNPDPVVGLTLLREVVAQVSIPVVAIGGITLARATEVTRTGVPLAAAVSALCAAHDPEAAARALHGALRAEER
jgi:thiamine-phosphate pyrophosphorylase